ncbi:hypothetical protein KIF24_20270 [Micromonospora sp. Llam7]|uniref:hypothetical protein n=1 Tax=Micromonospora tarapacensis TaxID=2835305 RepID=UPI001C83108D|nr:hypothetical protein [Micromonospora tarapacensis]MBX7268141.1 hypothetical protein [Micromonospora tarapacensis]
MTAKAAVAKTMGLAVVPPAKSSTPPDAQAVPLAAYPETESQPRAVRARTVWLAAVAVAALLLAGGLLSQPWRGSGNEGDSASAALSAGSRASASGPSAKPSVSPSVSVNPALDGCVVGTWEMTSMQIINHFENRDALFTSSGGLISRIWPDGTGVEDYSKLAPLTATINGHKYVEVLRGVRTSHSTTKGGRLRTSGFSGGPTYKVTRDGRKQSIEVYPSAAYNLPYTCTEDLLATYGNDKVSTQSFKRISHDPCAVVKGRSYVPPQCAVQPAAG